MDKKEFIRECAMRNLAACFAKYGAGGQDCVSEAYHAAVSLANTIYGKD